MDATLLHHTVSLKKSVVNFLYNSHFDMWLWKTRIYSHAIHFFPFSYGFPAVPHFSCLFWEWNQKTNRQSCLLLCYVNKHSYYVSFVQAEVPGTNSAKKWAVFRGACNFPGARSFLVEGEIIALFGRILKFTEWSCSFL